MNNAEAALLALHLNLLEHGCLLHFICDIQLIGTRLLVLQVAVLLQSSGEAGTLPDVYEVIYRSALAFAKAAAVDEMLGNFPAALRSYAKV